MHNDPPSPVLTTEEVEGIPLYLIPKTIADQIWKNGNDLLRIQVTRRFQNRYTITVEMIDDHAEQAKLKDPANRDGIEHG
jgi:hypothetical protein